MQKRRLLLKSCVVVGLTLSIYATSVTLYAAASDLRLGSNGTSVTNLQNNLKKSGYFNSDLTGYFGSLTESAVKKLQKKYGLEADGIVGATTMSVIDKITGKSLTQGKVLAKTTNTSKGSSNNTSKSKTVSTLTKSSKVTLKTTPKTTLKKTSNTPAKSTSPSTLKTSEKTNSIATQKAAIKTASRGDYERYGYLIPWFGSAENIFALGKVANVLDVETGLSFNIRRTYGYNHADCETLTQEDTEIMKKIYKGQWSWDRRAIIVTVDGIKIAASMAGMPHAGVDNEPEDINVSQRSGGYGAGENLDKVKGNSMDGHFDIHFLDSKTHGSDKVDKNHQEMVHKAAQWAENNL
ncbi:MAG: peptidoglycan-binding domain-containing protein [Bacillota bacterium]|nr:peptidoglycan-binding domain-containing protein [Bacillota bacterium]